MHEEFITPYLIGLFAVFCILLGILFSMAVLGWLRKRTIVRNEVSKDDYSRDPDKRYLRKMQDTKDLENLTDFSKYGKGYKSDYVNISYVQHMKRINREIELK